MEPERTDMTALYREICLQVNERLYARQEITRDMYEHAKLRLLDWRGTAS